MDFLSKQEAPVKFDFKAGDLTHTLILGSTSKGMSINPFVDFATESEWCLRMIQNAAQYDLGFDSFDLARSIGERVAATQVSSIKALVDAWGQVSTLKEFADAVAKCMLPQ